MSGHGPRGPGRPPCQGKNFKAAGRRVLRMLAPHKWLIALLTLLSMGGVILSVMVTKILGNATNVVSNGFISSRLPAGTTKAEVISGLRAAGDNRTADMLTPMDVVPGQGVDFTQLANLLLLVAAIYVGVAFLAWTSGRWPGLLCRTPAGSCFRTFRRKSTVFHFLTLTATVAETYCRA